MSARIRTFAIALAAWLVLGFMALAQENGSPTDIDYVVWEQLASRAEKSIGDDRASVEAFETLRSQITIWRERFLAGQNVNAARIETLLSQIDALGPAPEEGESEPEEIVERRASLRAQLSEARAPARTAEEAYSRADGMAKEIDKIIRQRQSEQLLWLGPTPVNPLNWPSAWGELGISLDGLWTEIKTGVQSEARLQGAQERLIQIILLIGLAALLFFRFPAWSDRAEIWALRQATPRGQKLIDFAFSLGVVVFPVLATWLLAQAAYVAALTEFRSDVMLSALPLAALYFFGAHWIGLRVSVVIGRDSDQQADATILQKSASILGLLLAVEVVLQALNTFPEFAAETLSIIYFIPVILSGIALFRIGRALERIVWRSIDDDEPGQYTNSVRWLGRVTWLLAAIIIALSVIGYMNAALYLAYAATLSLGLIAVLVLLNYVLRLSYGALMRVPEIEEGGLLVPTLISMALTVAVLPLFALAWGTRWADLSEMWVQFSEGVTLGETQISPTNFLTFVAVFIALFLATRIIQRTLRSNVLPKTDINDSTQNAIVSGLGYLGIFFAAIIAITSAGIDLSAFALVAGALSVGIGFGLQNIVQNFVSGIILLIERRVGEGDWIEVGGITGTVKKISVRSTLIEAFDRYEIIVPNAEFISGPVKNWTRQNTLGRIKIKIGVAYGNDTRKVAEILRKIAHEHPLVSMIPDPAVDFLGFGADSLDFQIRVVLRDVNYMLSVTTELNHRIAERFAEEGIEIPFAQRDIWIRNPESLSGAGAEESKG